MLKNKHECEPKITGLRHVGLMLSAANLLLGSYHLLDHSSDQSVESTNVHERANNQIQSSDSATSTTQAINTFQTFPSPLERHVVQGIEALGLEVVPADAITSDDQLIVAVDDCAALFNLVEQVHDQTELFGSSYGKTELLTDPVYHYADLAINNVQLPVYHFDTADPVGLGLTVSTTQENVQVLVDFIDTSMEDVCQRLESVE